MSDVLEGPPTREELVLRGLPAPVDTVLVAKNPQEMESAQGDLIQWAVTRLEELQAEFDDMEAAYNNARKNHWRASPMRRQMTRIRRRINYYTKVKMALEEGFYLIPNFPTDVVAIRTAKEDPKYYEYTDRGALGFEQQSEGPPPGEGAYVSPTPVLSSYYKDGRGREGQVKKVKWFCTERFAPFDFPFTVTKPQIINVTQRAMVRKIFDEIGILPQRQRRRGDPMIIGQVVLREGWSEKRISFLIAWFVDTETL